MKLYDSLHRELRAFTPQSQDRVTVYGCGPTVYDFAHIGNFRAFLVYDLLHRHLRAQGHKVEFVVNFTDVDDKTIAGAAQNGSSLADHTAPFMDAFLADAKTLGILPFSSHPRATAYIPQMVEFIKRLIHNNNAYQANDNSVYFSVDSFPNYGKLSGSRTDASERRSRISNDEYEKGDARDFVLWKAARPTDHQVGAVWESPWGPGRPGWHLECSVMGIALLGNTIDIHLGGEDLLFPHHENEIAQSECTTGAPFARFWLHVKHLKIHDLKMSKSDGNFHTVRELLEEGYDPAALRWVLLSAHYRNELNFTYSGLRAATATVQRLLDFRQRIDHFSVADGRTVGLADLASRQLAAFQSAMDDDLNAPRAVAALQTLVREANSTLDDVPEGADADELRALLDALTRMDNTFGILELAESTREVDESLENRIEAIVKLRDKARVDRDFTTADRLRDELATLGVQLEDTADGTRWKKGAQRVEKDGSIG